MRVRERYEDVGIMTATTTTVAMGGTMPKDDETRTSLQAAATAMAPSDVSLAPPPGPSLDNIICEGRDAAQKLSSCGDVNDGNNNDNGSNGNRWFQTN
jgi:hypothetical protein